MAQKYNHISVDKSTHVMAKALAKYLGITIPEVLLMAVGTMDKGLGLEGHKALQAEGRAIRSKMREKAGRVGAVRPGKRRRGNGPGGRRFDHGKWDFGALKVEGKPLVITGQSLSEGCRTAANRYRDATPGWAFTMVKVSPAGVMPSKMVYHLIRTA